MCCQLRGPPLELCIVREQDALDSVEDMREHDVPQHWRWAIDNDVRAGYWYTITAQASPSEPACNALPSTILLTLTTLPSVRVGHAPRRYAV